MNDALAVAAGVIAAPGALTAAHLGLLAGASLGYRRPAGDPDAPPVRFLVVVPAHDEAAVIGEGLASINRERRAGDLVLVVADRCTDATADIARAAGALVLERPASAPPGRSAAVADGLDHGRGLEWDAFITVDADSLVGPGFFDACERALAGRLVAQARSEGLPGRTVLEQASLAAGALDGVMKSRGRDRLGLSVRLRGSGMVVRRDIAETHSFRNPGASEDLWFSLDLCLAGVLARHADDARLRSASPRSLRSATVQRQRWELGRMFAAREYVGPLLRRHTASSLEAAAHLVTPPYALATLSVCLGIALAAVAGATTLAWVCVALLCVLATCLAIGMVEAGVGARTWLALLCAPGFVVWKAWVQLKAIARLRQPNVAYAPTPRD